MQAFIDHMMKSSPRIGQ